MAPAHPLKVKPQIYCGDEIAMGPGKADLIEAIERTGSISAAARDMGMSYRRAWLLVDAMNRCWSKPVVETVAGGSHERGARLSAFGKDLLQGFRQLESAVKDCGTAQFESDLARHLRTSPRTIKPEHT